MSANWNIATRWITCAYISIGSNTRKCIHEGSLAYPCIFHKNHYILYIKRLFMNISYCSIDSPLGELIAVADEDYLLLLEFSDSKQLQKKLSSLDIGESWSNPLLDQTEKELSEYFAWKRKNFSIPLAPTGTKFQQKAWEALTQIPFGETLSYKQEAILAWNPKAVRAIGGANNKNPIVIIIPCHRVIGADGNLVGYGGGMTRKIWLIEHEKKSL